MRRWLFWLLGLYALLTAYVVLRFYLRLPNQPLFTPILTFLAFIFALLHASQRYSWRRAVLFCLTSFVVSLAFESVGVATGLVYGPYHYTDLLGVKFLGLVPYLIPIAWFMMMYPSYLMATRLLPSTSNTWLWRLGAAGLGGVIMTAWDLAMDPLMVSSGNWVWEVQGGYFGVPLRNFAGWWVTSFVVFLLFMILARIQPPDRQPADFDRLAVWSYCITGLSSLLLGLPVADGGPALVGLFAMLPWVVMALAKPAPAPLKAAA